MSGLRDALAGYLEVRRALGYKLADDARLLGDFVAYLEQAGSDRITVDLALAWATTPADAQPVWWSKRLGVVRVFARHLHSLDARTEIPPTHLLPRHAGRAEPYLYSEADIAALMAAARALRPPLRAATYATLVGLLAVTGLRVGEAIRADRADLDWANELLVVRESKLGKSRQVPLHPSTVEALRGYERYRDQHCPSPAASSLFVSIVGTRLIYKNVQRTFGQLVTGAGLRPRSGRRRPRLHDLRHTFAMRTLAGWLGDGGDVDARLPALSTWLGHVDPSSTYWYWTATPELLGLAAQRLDSVIGQMP